MSLLLDRETIRSVCKPAGCGIGAEQINAKSCGREKRELNEAFFLSALSEVLPSDDEDSADCFGDDFPENAITESPVARRPGRTRGLSLSLKNLPESVPLEVIVNMDDDDGAAGQEDTEDHSLHREELNIAEEEAEEPLPDFANTVDALSRLSMSASTTSLPRSRGGGPRRLRRVATDTATTASVDRNPNRRARSMTEMPAPPLLVRESRDMRRTLPGRPRALDADCSDQPPRRPLQSLRIDRADGDSASDSSEKVMVAQ